IGSIIMCDAARVPSPKDGANGMAQSEGQPGTEEEKPTVEPILVKKPHREILDHERKRRVELKCMELQEMMEEQGYTEDEIRQKVSTFRQMLMDKEVYPTFNGYDVCIRGKVVIYEVPKVVFFTFRISLISRALTSELGQFWMSELASNPETFPLQKGLDVENCRWLPRNLHPSAVYFDNTCEVAGFEACFNQPKVWLWRQKPQTAQSP
uniref:CWF21 domain-containing protein n=1 Tax=Mola mola TaxID=94237 RepID=A0A3Q4AS40_MOLML